MGRKNRNSQGGTDRRLDGANVRLAGRSPGGGPRENRSHSLLRRLFEVQWKKLRSGADLRRRRQVRGGLRRIGHRLVSAGRNGEDLSRFARAARGRLFASI